MIGLCILSASLIGYCIFFSGSFNLKAEETPVFTISVLILLLYILSLAQLLWIGVYIVTVIGYLLTIMTVIMKRKTVLPFIKTFITPGFILFIIGIPILYKLSSRIIFTNWDEFSHWGLVVKAMNLKNALPGNDSMLTFLSYPTGTALLQYYMCRIFGQREGIIVFAQVLYVWAAAVSFTKGIKLKQIYFAFLILAAAFVGYVHFNISLWCIYVDGLLGLLLGSAFVVYYSEKRDTSALLKTVPILMAVVLIKESGVFLSVLFCIFMLLDQLYLQKAFPVETGEKKNSFFSRHAVALSLGVAVLCIVMTNISWSLYLASMGIAGGQGLLNSFMQSAGTAANPGVIPAFINALPAKAVGTSREYQFLSSPLLLLGITVVPFILLTALTTDKSKKRRILLLTGFFIFFFLIYCIGLILIYMFKFSSFEGENLASFGRYLGTYFLMLYLVVNYLLIRGVADGLIRKAPKVLSIILSLLLIFYLTALTPKNALNFFVRTTSNPLRSKINEQAAYIQSIIKPSERVYVIWEHTNGKEYGITKYEFYPVQVSRRAYSIGVPSGSADIWTRNFSAAEWSDMLKDYKYLFVGKTDDAFQTQYGSLFEKGTVSSNSWYTVCEQSNGSVILKSMK